LEYCCCKKLQYIRVNRSLATLPLLEEQFLNTLMMVSGEMSLQTVLTHCPSSASDRLNVYRCVGGQFSATSPDTSDVVSPVTERSCVLV
jgi:hypothetical protein